MEPKHVDLLYYNLGQEEIRIVRIEGLPSGLTPGHLVPMNDDTNTLAATGVTVVGSIAVADRLKIVWEESDISRELELRRVDLGLPPRLENIKVRFTYLGNGEWRVVSLQ